MRKKVQLCAYFFMIILSPQISDSAVHPTTGFSTVNISNTLSFLSQFGFSVSYLPSDWKLQSIESTEKSQKALFAKKTAQIHFFTEIVNKNTDLEKYARRYLKDFNQFGFDLSKIEAFKAANNSKTEKIILQLSQKNRKTSAHQFFIQHDKKIVVSTCIDQAENFKFTSLQCADIIKNLVFK